LYLYVRTTLRTLKPFYPDAKMWQPDPTWP
jgi:hypothetical protein